MENNELQSREVTPHPSQATPSPRGEGKRDIGVITGEIKELRRQAENMAMLYAVEIGRRLVEAKAALPHGEWGAWLKDEVEFSQSTANNFMRLFEEYGAAQISIFGASVNSQSIANLPYTKALQLLALPKEERESFAQEVDAEHLSVKELKEAIKAKEEAEAQAKESKEQAETLASRVFELEEATREAEKRAEKADELEKTLAEMESKREKEIAQARKEASDSAVREAEAAAEKALEEARAQAEAAKEELKKAQEAEMQAKAKLEEAQKKLKTARPEVAAFKSLFDQMQSMGMKLKGMIDTIGETDTETAEKLKAALKAFGASL